MQRLSTLPLTHWNSSLTQLKSSLPWGNVAAFQIQTTSLQRLNIFLGSRELAQGCSLNHLLITSYKGAQSESLSIKKNASKVSWSRKLYIDMQQLIHGFMLQKPCKFLVTLASLFSCFYTNWVRNWSNYFFCKDSASLKKKKHFPCMIPLLDFWIFRNPRIG